MSFPMPIIEAGPVQPVASQVTYLSRLQEAYLNVDTCDIVPWNIAKNAFVR
jgi:hypothetical protein